MRETSRSTQLQSERAGRPSSPFFHSGSHKLCLLVLPEGGLEEVKESIWKRSLSRGQLKQYVCVCVHVCDVCIYDVCMCPYVICVYKHDVCMCAICAYVMYVYVCDAYMCTCVVCK